MISITSLADLCFNVFRNFLSYISAVGICNLILLVKGIGKPLAVVNGGFRYCIICDDFSFCISLCVVLITIVGFVVLLCTAGIRVLLCQLMLGLGVFSFSSLDTSPDFIVLFSSHVLLCRGASTKVASMMVPVCVMIPFLSSSLQ